MTIRRAIPAVLALAALAAAAGCSSGKHQSAASPPPPQPSNAAQSSGPDMPGAKALRGTGTLRKPHVYSDNIQVEIVKISTVKEKGRGPGTIDGRQLAIFTLRFSNGSPAPLNLNQVKITAKYGPKHTVAQVSQYGDLNDFNGKIAAGATQTAGYGFVLPQAGYQAVQISVKFDGKHPVAVFSGALAR